jgi:hypothetical protein
VNNPARVTGISPRTIPERSVSTIKIKNCFVHVERQRENIKDFTFASQACVHSNLAEKRNSIELLFRN